MMFKNIETSSMELEEVLKIEKFRKLVNRISKIPTHEEFKDKAEKEFQELIGLEEAVPYEDLPEYTKNLIGIIPEKENGLPWWLKSFSWRIRERGRDSSSRIDARFLRKELQNYHKDSYILPPTLSKSYYLDNLHSIRDTLLKNLEIENIEVAPDLPESFFEKNEQGIRTTDEFKEWFDNTLELFPPLQDQLTSLLLITSRIKENIAEEHLGKKVINKLRDWGMVDNQGKIDNSSIYGSLIRMSGLKGIFDLFIEVPEEFRSFDIPPLQILLFIAFKEMMTEVSSETSSRIKKWIDISVYIPGSNLDIPELREFSSVAHFSPLCLTYARAGRKFPKVLFLSRQTGYPVKNIGSINNHSKAREFKSLFKKLNLLEES